MAVEPSTFARLGGFDRHMSVAEDQDLALRHSADSGRIVFVPAARTVHRDNALTLERYCMHAERYMEAMAAFRARHPVWPDNIERERVNGPARWREEPAWSEMKKLVKQVLVWRPVHAGVLQLVGLGERLAPNSGLLNRMYRWVLGAHLLRGYRRGQRVAQG